MQPSFAWPVPVLVRAATILLPTRPRPPPLPDTHDAASKAAHTAACQASCADVRAMRLVSKEFCAAATLALIQVHAWLSPELAVAPPGRWAEQSSRVQTINILVPASTLAADSLDPNPVQSDLEKQLNAQYQGLTQVMMYGACDWHDDHAERVNDNPAAPHPWRSSRVFLVPTACSPPLRRSSCDAKPVQHHWLATNACPLHPLPYPCWSHPLLSLPLLTPLFYHWCRC